MRLCTASLIHSIEKNFSEQSPTIKSSEVLPIISVVFCRLAGELINVAVEHDANDVLGVELVLDEILGERIEQLGDRRGVCLTQIIDFVDEAASEKMAPQAIHHGLGK